MPRPFFSIIVPFYQGVITDEAFDRFVALAALERYTGADFELVLLHDGPLLRPCSQPVVETARRENVWGHNLRALGLQRARGIYVIHTNADNVLAPGALGVLQRVLQQDPCDVLIACARMRGLRRREDDSVYYDEPRDYSVSTLLTGNPPRFSNIDLMQLIARRDEVWQHMGWPVRHRAADAFLYARICREFPPKFSSVVIGEHF